MATRGTIALFGKKAIKVYTHWDGYLDHNGLILLTSFNRKRRLKYLLSFGEISSLNTKVKVTKKVKDAFNSSSTTSFYHRDRNESLNVNYNGDEEYNYIFYKGNWYVYYNDFKGKLDLLKVRRVNGKYKISYRKVEIPDDLYKFILRVKR